MKNKFGRLTESRKLEMLQMKIEEIYNAGYQHGHNIGYETGAYNERTGACEEPVNKSPNQRRAELIQRAREFVKFKKRFLINSEEITGGYPAKKRENPVYVADISKVDFVVNAEKRAVVAILKGFKTGRLISKGIAKCHPDEVFNVDIGKAIALARALEIEVPGEFLDAVQPDEKVLGMVVLTVLDGIKTIVDAKNYKPDSGLCMAKSLNGIESTIIIDSNAQYEVTP